MLLNSPILFFVFLTVLVMLYENYLILVHVGGGYIIEVRLAGLSEGQQV